MCDLRGGRACGGGLRIVLGGVKGNMFAELARYLVLRLLW